MDFSKPFNYPFADENRVKRRPSFELLSESPPEGLEGLYELVESMKKSKEKEEPAKTPDHGNVTPPPPDIKIERRRTLASLIPPLSEDLFREKLVRFEYIFF